MDNGFTPICIEEIMTLLPHRYPFLLVDRIVELDPGVRIVGVKNVTMNEPFFQGHFPGHPIMPGVLVIEAMAQVGGILALKALGGEKRIAYFTAIDSCRFRKPVIPGDVIRLEVDLVARRGPFWKMRGVATVDGSVVAEAEITASLPENRVNSGEGGKSR